MREIVRHENGESNPCRRQGKPGEVPRDRVKDGLLEPQPPAMDKHIPRHGMSGRGRPDRAVSLSPPETPPAERRPTRPSRGRTGDLRRAITFDSHGHGIAFG